MTKLSAFTKEELEQELEERQATESCIKEKQYRRLITSIIEALEVNGFNGSQTTSNNIMVSYNDQIFCLIEINKKFLHAKF